MKAVSYERSVLKSAPFLKDFRRPEGIKVLAILDLPNKIRRLRKRNPSLAKPGASRLPLPRLENPHLRSNYRGSVA